MPVIGENLGWKYRLMHLSRHYDWNRISRRYVVGNPGGIYLYIFMDLWGGGYG